MKHILLLIGLIYAFSSTIGQDIITLQLLKERNIRLQTSVMADNLNSWGPRLFFEYMSEFQKFRRFSWGVSYENKWHLARYMTDFYPPSINTNSLRFNIHYKLPIWKDKLHWDFGSGLGGIYATDGKAYAFRPLLSLEANLNIKLRPNLYLETAPLLFLLPFSQVNISTNNLYKNTDVYTQFAIYPIGLKWRL